MTKAIKKLIRAYKSKPKAKRSYVNAQLQFMCFSR